MKLSELKREKRTEKLKKKKRFEIQSLADMNKVFVKIK